MEGEGIPEAHVRGLDMEHRAPALPDSVKTKLPTPIMEENREWLELYWRTWEIVFDKVYDPPAESGFVPFVDEGFSTNIFQWDTCFMMGYLRYVTSFLPVHGTLDNFYRKQHVDGFICREINQLTGDDFWPKDHLSNINPPLFAWSEVGFYQITADKNRIKKVLPHLVSYFEWLKDNRLHEDGVGYWTTALSSGMDNTPRAYDKGGTDAHLHYDHVWLCMTAQQALNARSIAYLAGEVEDDALAARFNSEFSALKAYINETLWNEELEFYFDLDSDREHVRVKTPAAFWPLVAGVASTEQAGRAAQRIFNPAEFWRPHALPSLSADHELYHPRGNYWQGGVWAPLVYMTLRGLNETGLHEEAIRLAANHLDSLYAVYKSTGTLWENYAPEEESRGNISRPEFAGWTGNGPTAALIETILGFSVDAPHNSITWKLHRSDRHGIQKLPFGDGFVDLLYNPLMNEVEVATPGDLVLIVERNGRRQVIPVFAGDGSYQLVS